ncbi:hypothetical protein [Caballeronia concitans]|uniref:hypothetical protein n=1 Tax=Caballeronia concitans TaxID=1777133 RepID=UPI000B359B12|nr:hypothetical protein [Caballeronia concitans]
MTAQKSRVEQDLVDAFERLKNGTPKDPRLAKKAKIGGLRINPSTVAQEAGCSRTLIGLEDCRYPTIRKSILEYKDSVAKPASSFEEINRELRRENHTLRNAVAVAATRIAAMILQRDETVAKAKQDVDEVKRQLSHALEGKKVKASANVSPISATRHGS